MLYMQRAQSCSTGDRTEYGMGREGELAALICQVGAQQGLRSPRGTKYTAPKYMESMRSVLIFC